MPTKVMIKANNVKSQGFPHAEYLDMTFLGAFRTYGMKNPGYKEGDKRYTFVGRVYDNCISYEYKEKNEPGDASDAIPDPDPTDKNDMAALGAGVDAQKGEEAEAEEPEAKGGSRRTSRRRRTARKINKRKNAKKVTRKKRMNEPFLREIK